MRWPRAVVHGAVVAVAIVTTLAGCAPGPNVVITTGGDGHVLLAQARDTGVYPLAEVKGALTLVGTCYGLETAFDTYTVVFPPGSSIVEGTDQIAIPHWGTLRIGDELPGGGGYYTAGDLDYYDQIPEACRTDEIAVVNPFG